MTDPSINISGSVGGDAFSGGKREINTAGGDYYEGVAPAGVAALHQLPAPLADFTGRAAELDQLRRAVRQDHATILNVRGMGGIGKTALALVLANELSADYPDAQFFLDLQGVGKPLAPAAVMAHVIRAYKPVEKLPNDPDQLQAIYRSLLSGQRALLLLDNARDADQVRPLIPPAGCLLLVTTRRRFSLPGQRAVNLGSLPPADAERLLLDIAPRVGHQAGELAELCGRLPLALRLVGSALDEREDLDPASFAGRLKDEATRVRLIEASLALSYDLLAPDLRRLWLLLAVFPADFDAQAAAAVWELAPDLAGDRLGDLLRFSLLDFDPESKRYSLHDLARNFAHSRLSDVERDGAHRRHAAHYQAVLARAQELYLAGDEHVARGLAIFDLERANIAAGHAWAAARAGLDEAAARLASDYSSFGAYVLDLRQRPSERVVWLEAALAAAQRLKDRAAEGVHLGNLGLAYRELGQARHAIECHEEALAIARELGDRMGEGQELGNLGLTYASLGEARHAIGFYEQQLKITQEIGDMRGEGIALSNLGSAHSDLAEPQRALEYGQKALDIFHFIGDRRAEGGERYNIANAFQDLGEPSRAIEYYEQALALHAEIGDIRSQGHDLFNKAVALDSLGDRPAAILSAEAALSLYEQAEDPNVERVTKVLEEWRGGSFGVRQ